MWRVYVQLEDDTWLPVGVACTEKKYAEEIAQRYRDSKRYKEVQVEELP